MPRMDDDTIEDDSGSLAKVLLIGDGKIGKSWWSGMAASFGFNLLYFDADVGRPTLKQLPKDVRRNIYALDVADTLGGGVKDSKFLDVMSEFTNSVRVRWNDTHQRLATKNDDPTDVIWTIRPAKMDSTCVMVLDSWTALSESIMTASAIQHGVSLTDASTPEMRPVYQSAGLKSMAMLQVIRSMRCHVIVIAHPDEYSHTTKPEGRKVKDIKETELVVDWTKLIPKSTSKPNSMQMAKYFTDILWAETNATGSERLINARLDANRLSGGHWTGRESFDVYSFGNLVRLLGGGIPGDAGAPVDSWLQIGQGQPSLLSAPTAVGLASHANPASSQAAVAPTQILDGTQQAAIQTPTMRSLFAKKAATTA